MLMRLASSGPMPSVLVSGGVMLLPQGFETHPGEDAANVQTVGARFAQGEITLEYAADVGCHACASPGGGCQFLGTAATSQVAAEALGLSRPIAPSRLPASPSPSTRRPAPRALLPVSTLGSATRDLTPTVCFPVGNLAAEGSMIQSTSIDPTLIDSDDMYRHTGPTRVFITEAAAIPALKTGSIGPRGLLVTRDHQTFASAPATLDELLASGQLRERCQQALSGSPTSAPARSEWLAPIGSEELWAAGVTYFAAATRGMEESKDAGGGTFYDRVYDAERPELFFKSAPHRVVGPGDTRTPSHWPTPTSSRSPWNALGTLRKRCRVTAVVLTQLRVQLLYLAFQECGTLESSPSCFAGPPGRASVRAVHLH